jgi:DNA-binding Lrp family transcriptional regulator
MSRRISSSEEYATSGPLARIFENPVARIIDQSLLVGNMEQTISMLSESTNLSFKTVQKTVKKLEELRIMSPTRKVGNAQAYKFNVECEIHKLVDWATEFQKEQTIAKKRK